MAFATCDRNNDSNAGRREGQLLVSPTDPALLTLIDGCSDPAAVAPVLGPLYPSVLSGMVDKEGEKLTLADMRWSWFKPLQETAVEFGIGRAGWTGVKTVVCKMKEETPNSGERMAELVQVTENAAGEIFWLLLPGYSTAYEPKRPD
jgi:hypothetical protein